MNREIYKTVTAALFAVIAAAVAVTDTVNGTFLKLPLCGSVSEASDSIIDNEPLSDVFLGISGAFGSLIDMSGYYNDIGIYIDDDHYMYSPSEETDTGYEVTQTAELKKYLDEKGINLIYINQPTKYLDDGMFVRRFGVMSYSNRNADRFLGRIREAGVNTVDLREYIVSEGLDIRDMFYATDHHWTVETGFWAAEKTAEALNRFAGYDIDLSLYDKSRFRIRKWEKCWIGEQGRKAYSRSLIPDDFTNISPDFPTSFYFKDLDVTGDFGMFYDESVYDPQSVLSKSSWHYSYQMSNVVNNNVDKGKILMVCDSYSYVSEPFTALAVHSVDTVILRDTKESLRSIIERGDYDTVLICYAQFMIGAHDDPDSANYRMFDFS